jgi:hypothetical protein
MMGGMSETGLRPADALRDAIERCGYYPDVVVDSLEVSLAGEPVVSFLVHHEATFDRDELRRHLTVLVLTPTRLVIGHTDDHPAEEDNPPFAATSTEAVRLERIGSVVVSRVIDDPVTHEPGGVPREVVLSIGWGVVSRLDLEPASCGDPDCEADHGFTGTASLDDFSLRVSHAGDGPDGVSRALEFARALSRATTR